MSISFLNIYSFLYNTFSTLILIFIVLVVMFYDVFAWSHFVLRRFRIAQKHLGVTYTEVMQKHVDVTHNPNTSHLQSICI